MRLLHKPLGPTACIFLIWCSNQTQRIEALITHLHLVDLKCACNFFHNFVVILMVMFYFLNNLFKKDTTWKQDHLLPSNSSDILKQSKSISC